ncbi:MAG: hypothetical protein GTN36_00025 [Candidatus Aenigmarchaeota archaeon]|nr:hypothetical protein [Candidatus Aenigmarchaeota archaeon]
MPIEAEKLEIKLHGIIKGIPFIKRSLDEVETLLEVQCESRDLKIVEKKIKSVEEKYKYDPFDRLKVEEGSIRRLKFNGQVHSDIIGKEFRYDATVMEPFAKGLAGEYVLINQSLTIGNKRLYTSCIKRQK